MKLTETPNRLINEKSPYLLQHARNPVDWFPWGYDAFEKAKKEDKPVFLSIGYSTCHWCHVMERESFEDEEVAQILNQHYVSIKVDREERPDIDTIYMSVCQAMTGHGGWPLTIIMTPDKKPFYAGTYFPKTSSRGMPGVIDLLTQINQIWKNDKEKVLKSSNEITEEVRNSMFEHAQGDIREDTLHRVFQYYDNSFDSHFGGFGKAPKFPTPHNLSFLLRYWKLTGKDRALEMVEKTLDSMYLGGIYDHIGFGFARYSTDQMWLVPHFEKMLYDNALLAISYLEAYQATRKEKFASIAREIFTYVLRDMTSPEGAFYSAEDADSEGEEGKFYVWTPAEVKEVAGSEEGSRFCNTYDITAKGNFEGKSIPNLIHTGFVKGYDETREKLFQKRKNRVHPFKDDKILTSWNGLMIAALAYGARVLDEPKYAHAAENAFDFILKNLRREDGRLLARYRDGDAAHLGYVDDYTFLIWGLIELYESTFKDDYLSAALELNQELLHYFWDEQNGGLFQYAIDAETLISRPKEIYDGALPSGNSVAALNFLRLAQLTGSAELEQTASTQLNSFGGSVNKMPMGHTHFLMAVYFNLVSKTEVSIVGNIEAEETKEMLKIVNKYFRPELVMSVKSSFEEREKLAVEGKTTAYVCKEFTCQKPTSDSGELENLLNQ